MASPLYRLLVDHFDRFHGCYEDQFERQYGRRRAVVAQVVAKFLDCGVLEAGFARVRCDECRAEFLLAYSGKCRYFCPSHHAKRLANRAEAAEGGEVIYTSDKAAGPTTGCHTFDPLEFIARLLAHIPDKGQVLQRYYGYYANRTSGERRKAAEAGAADAGTPLDGDRPIAEAEDFSRREARRR